jgi:hypothetical protein
MLGLFDFLAAPHPETNDGKDPRSPGQRRHDALLAALETAQRAGNVPTAGGISATLVITMTHQTYLSGKGLARTAHGALVPAREALTWGGGDTRILTVAMNSTREITAYSSTHRLFNETSDSRSPPATAAAASPGAPPRPAGAKPTTSPATPTADQPRSTTAPCSAATTTANTPNKAGPAPWSTANPTGPHPPGSTPTKSRYATTCTTADRHSATRRGHPGRARAPRRARPDRRRTGSAEPPRRSPRRGGYGGALLTTLRGWSQPPPVRRNPRRWSVVPVWA